VAKEKADNDDDNDDVSDEEGSTFSAGLGFKGGNRKNIGGAKKSFKFTKSKEEGGQIAGLRTAVYQPPVSLGKGFGDWEKYTRGIGAKLLLQVRILKSTRFESADEMPLRVTTNVIFIKFTLINLKCFISLNLLLFNLINLLPRINC